jgi:hypothetical protein
MSLVTTASTWINDNNNISKKRQSTMSRSIKLNPISSTVVEPDEYVSQSENYQNLESSEFNKNQNAVNTHNTRVNDLLNKITITDSEENNKLGSFKPLANPELNVKKDMDDNTEPRKYTPPKISFLNALSTQKGAQYSPDDSHVNNLSNYNKSYDANPSYVPYYAKMGIGASGMGDDKLLEKINYMIQLLEEQRTEKTSNITEEFILYTFLGVFIIFVVDSFARSGKYIR